MQRSHVVAGSLVALVACAVLVWFLGGSHDDPVAAPRNAAAHSAGLGAGDATALPSPTSELSNELASAVHALDARTSLDDRRTWSATLAFAPDMAWLAPQLVWRVRAAGGDGDDVLEPLAPFPSDPDGDGAIELALHVPPARDGERVVLDLHLREGTVPCIATLDLPDDGARVPVEWSDVPLVAAGFVREHGLAGVQLRYSILMEASDGPHSLEDLEPSSGSVEPLLRTMRGPNGEFAVLKAPLPKPGNSRNTWVLSLERNDRPLSSQVPITIGQTGVLLEVDRGEVRVALLLDPAFEYPGMVLRVDDATGATKSWPLDELRSRAVSPERPVVVESALAAGPAALAISHTRLANQLIEGAARAPLRFDVPRGALVEIPNDGPLDVHAEPDVAVLRLEAPSSARVTGSWECDSDYPSAFVSKPAPESETGEVRSTNWVLVVPSDARRLIVEAPGCRRVELDAWRGETREAVLDAIPPAHITVDWSACSMSGHGGEVDIQVWGHRVDRSVDPDAAFKPLACAQFVHPMGFKGVMEVPLRDDVEIANVFVRWKPPSAEPPQGAAQTKYVFLTVLDITSGGVPCFVDDPRGVGRRLRIEIGRAYVIHVGDAMQSQR